MSIQGSRGRYLIPPRKYGTASPDTRVTMMLVAFKEALSRDEWIKFCDTATSNSHTVAEALRTLIQIYVEDREVPPDLRSFTPSPKTTNQV